MCHHRLDNGSRARAALDLEAADGPMRALNRRPGGDEAQVHRAGRALAT
jgi:hypothetical protein